ncbi:MAG: UPF0262 family protein [Hyphomicrobiaceae bacterium]
MTHADEPAEGGSGVSHTRERLVAITLDERSISQANANVVHEREVAIYDILDQNMFAIEGRDDGPFTLDLSIVEDRLVFTVGTPQTTETLTFMLALSALRRIIRDYFSVCDTYYQAIRTAPPSRIQTIDMGRRALHDEGSQVLIERLKGKIALDHATARRLFTLICALHWKG